MSDSAFAAESKSAHNRPVRVLHLRDSPWVDGPGRTIIESGAHFDKQRVDYHIGAFVAGGQATHPLVETARARGLQVHMLKDHGGLDRELIAHIRRLIVELEIDILHTSDNRSNIFGLLCRRGLPITLVSTTHGWIANNFRRRAYCTLDKMLLRWFDAVVMVSHAMRRRVPVWWLPNERTHIVHNALVLDSYGRDILSRERCPVTFDRDITLINIGRLSPEKGQGLLLEAFARLIKRYPMLRLRFIGIGQLEQALRAQADQLGVANRVEFPGFIADMPKEYLSADLVVQSSLTEGLPNVILEAAYLRAPIVATTVGGTDEVVEHGKSAWLIKPGSVDELYVGIEAFLSDPSRFADMARLAHERILSEFSMVARTERMMRLYESLRPAD